MFTRIFVLLPFVLFVSASMQCPTGHHATCCSKTIQNTDSGVKQALQQAGHSDLVSGIQSDQSDTLVGIDCYDIDSSVPVCTETALCCAEDLTGKDGQLMSIHCSKVTSDSDGQKNDQKNDQKNGGNGSQSPASPVQ